jgi:hypothetical protein
MFYAGDLVSEREDDHLNRINKLILLILLDEVEFRLE